MGGGGRSVRPRAKRSRSRAGLMFVRHACTRETPNNTGHQHRTCELGQTARDSIGEPWAERNDLQPTQGTGTEL